MASPLKKTSSNYSVEQTDSSQLSPLPSTGLHAILGTIRLAPETMGTPGIHESNNDIPFVMVGNRATFHLPEREKKAPHKEEQYKPPDRKKTQLALEAMFLVDYELADSLSNSYAQFEKACRHSKMDCIKKLQALLEPHPKDSEDRATHRKGLKLLTYEFAHALHDNNVKTDDEPDEYPKERAVLLGYSCLLFAIMAQEDHPGAACRMAIKAMIYALDMGGVHKEFADMAMSLAAQHVSELDISNPEDKVAHLNRGVRAYTLLAGKNRDWKWKLMESAQTDAMEVPPPNTLVALYWDHWKELCIFEKADSDQKGNTEKSRKYNEQGLKALQQSGLHKSPTYYLDNSLMKLGLPMGLDNTQLLSTTEQPLYDCQHAERIFRVCAQIKAARPIGTSETVSCIQEIEKRIRQGHMLHSDPCRISILGIQRLFGSSILTKDVGFADRIFERIPSFQNLLSPSIDCPQDRRQELLKRKKLKKHKRPPEEVLIAAKLLFLRGAEAEAEGNSKTKSQRFSEAKALLDKAQECYLASAEGGFAGGYTRLALTADKKEEADTFLQIATQKGDISAWRSMGDLLFSQGKMQESQEYYTKSSEYVQGTWL